MKAKYLSRNAACAMAADSQHLVGQPFDLVHSIQMVVAGPYSRIIQWAYVSALIHNKPLPANPNNRHDVLLVSLAPETPAGFLVQSLRSFMEEHGGEYDFARYRKAQPAGSAS